MGLWLWRAHNSLHRPDRPPFPRPQDCERSNVEFGRQVGPCAAAGAEGGEEAVAAYLQQVRENGSCLLSFEAACNPQSFECAWLR